MLNLPRIAEQGRCIAIDSIGYGQSIVAPDTEYGIREWVRHAVRVLDALGIDKTWIVGNSIGGWVALQFAIDFPERLLGIVSMGTGGAKKTAAWRVIPRLNCPKPAFAAPWSSSWWIPPSSLTNW